MPYLQLQDRQFPLSAGESTIGAYEGAAVRLPGSDSEARAIVTVGASGLVIRRANPTSVVLVNGVQLGAEPSPLLHGDRVEIAGHELRVGEDQKGGSTQFVSASEIAAVIAGGAAPKKPTMATGGRLVSLVDGREYTVVDAGITFGREVGHDVVIASSQISRRHASLAPGPDGYVLTDHSTNGIWVNGQRMGDTQVLGRGDVIKMGTEEFRFYADVAKAAAAVAPVSAAPIAAPAPAAAPVVVAAPVAAAPAPVAPAAVAPAPVAPPPVAPAPAAPARAPLAVLEVIAEGPFKGRKFELHSALTNIGRGDHNDIALKDESVSDSHAKLQKRGDGWWIVDQGSTNGTYVGGRRVQSEQRIEGAPDLRFGGIKMTFRAAAVPVEDGSGTRAIAAVNIDAARRAAASRTPSLAKVPAAVVPEERKKGCATMIAFFFVTLAGAGASLLGILLYVGR
ncbi:MAG: FHA domain-containing protein [Gemmatimonadaceae bacterium]